jgi:hypothetical protein
MLRRYNSKLFQIPNKTKLDLAFLIFELLCSPHSPFRALLGLLLKSHATFFPWRADDRSPRYRVKCCLKRLGKKFTDVLGNECAGDDAAAELLASHVYLFK